MSCEEKREQAARLGAEGERRVADYLRRKGCIIVKRNYRDRFGEIDIIAENETYLIFVEVKTRSADAPVSGFEAVDSAKRRRLSRTGLAFVRRLRTDLRPRFDVAEVTVSLGQDGRESWHLRYIENAF